MAVIFDGKKYAEEVTKVLVDRVTELEKKLGRKLKLVTIYNPSHEASRVYTNIKAKKALELGVEFQKLPITNFQLPINDSIIKLNNDKTVDGIMVQMPLGTENDQFLIDLIDLKKDVDGLNPKSGVQPATVRAVIEILATSPLAPLQNFGEGNVRGEVLVVGNKGLVGKRLQEELGCGGMDKDDFDPTSLKLRGASVIISATGVASLIKDSMVKNGVIAIDVGYPKGDFDPDVAQKAGFFTPVPGGVGPVTVAMLFQNLVGLVNYRLL